ncbi:MAG: hypothetical protein M1816_000836 [Peltula sp. TS41687]|nr:MAG: hypothetical protein M1816_000836 [Peltula sp. TS41687]
MPETIDLPRANSVGSATAGHGQDTGMEKNSTSRSRGWRTRFGLGAARARNMDDNPEMYPEREKPTKWSMGILNDKETNEVPGSVLLLPSSDHNRPLGLQGQPVTIPEAKKRTADGKIILDPQPDDSLNDPLNWVAWRRDAALLSLGFFCMVGGGMTPILAAGFNDVAKTYHVSIPQVALTTGLYMMGLGLGSVLTSPTAILYGKRPVYLVGTLCFSLSAVWCAASPNYTSLVIARIFQGLAVSPCESLPSATIAEIFFLHERAYRVGIYTLLLLGGKNLIPLVSAAIIQGLGWRWVFWIVAIVVGFCSVLLFLFVPETFWDRVPHAKNTKSRRPSLSTRRTVSSVLRRSHPAWRSMERMDMGVYENEAEGKHHMRKLAAENSIKGNNSDMAGPKRSESRVHVGWAKEDDPPVSSELSDRPVPDSLNADHGDTARKTSLEQTIVTENSEAGRSTQPASTQAIRPSHSRSNSSTGRGIMAKQTSSLKGDLPRQHNEHSGHEIELNSVVSRARSPLGPAQPIRYTAYLKDQPPRTFLQSMKPWNGQLRHESWIRVAIRPFILFAYPAVLWSTMVYSLSVGWLIVLSETVASIYRTQPYNFSALGTGLVYLSPLIGGILGTAVAGKVSDIIVRFLSRRNGGIYEPEFRLVMALPIAILTCIGLMGFGWAAEEHDKWIVPTFFFGVISFGCCLGSTTAITFCVDSYRQYAGEALVTLNFSKSESISSSLSLFLPLCEAGSTSDPLHAVTGNS